MQILWPTCKNSKKTSKSIKYFKEKGLKKRQGGAYAVLL
jgi:hypothetical protein